MKTHNKIVRLIIPIDGFLYDLKKPSNRFHFYSDDSSQNGGTASSARKGHIRHNQYASYGAPFAPTSLIEDPAEPSTKKPPRMQFQNCRRIETKST